MTEEGCFCPPAQPPPEILANVLMKRDVGDNKSAAMFQPCQFGAGCSSVQILNVMMMVYMALETNVTFDQFLIPEIRAVVNKQYAPGSDDASMLALEILISATDKHTPEAICKNFANGWKGSFHLKAAHGIEVRIVNKTVSLLVVREHDLSVGLSSRDLQLLPSNIAELATCHTPILFPPLGILYRCAEGNTAHQKLARLNGMGHMKDHLSLEHRVLVDAVAFFALLAVDMTIPKEFNGDGRISEVKVPADVPATAEQLPRRGKEVNLNAVYAFCVEMWLASAYRLDPATLDTSGNTRSFEELRSEIMGKNLPFTRGDLPEMTNVERARAVTDLLLQ